MLKNKTFTHNEKLEMSEAISKLKQLDAIRECKPSNDQFLSTIFLTPKPNGGQAFHIELESFEQIYTQRAFQDGGSSNSM